MNLFIYDQKIQFDSLLPLIDLIKKENKSVIILNTNPINYHKKNDLKKILKKNNILNIDYPPVSISIKIKIFFFKILILLPKILIKNFEGFWWKISNNIYFDKKNFSDFLKEKKILNIFLPNDYLQKKKKFIYEIKSSNNFKIIEVEIGARTLISAPYGKNSFPLSLCDYFISSNDDIPDISLDNKKKVKSLGSLRYSKYWQEKLRENSDIRLNVHGKIKVGLLLNERIQSIDTEFIKKIYNIKDVHLEIVHKPKSVMPEKCCDYINDKLNGNQLIDWADVIISHSTTLLIEAIQKNKVVFYCKFLDYYENIEEIEGSVFDNISGFHYFKHHKELIETLSNFRKFNKKNYNYRDFDIINNLKGFKNDNDLINNYKTFINKLC